MIKTVLPGDRSGEVFAPSSKSQLHRLLICAALGERTVTVSCRGISEDVRATIRCLNALGAEITSEENMRITVYPITGKAVDGCVLDCGESGSTLRFLLPLVGALGVRAAFQMAGRLPSRPIEPLCAALRRNGMDIRREGATLLCCGQLKSGSYTLPADVSSQFVSALLMTLPHLAGDSSLELSGKTESAAYITMTEDVLHRSGIRWEIENGVYHIAGAQRCDLPAQVRAEGDWSGAAFFLCAGAFSERGICVRGLDLSSVQGDRAIVPLLARMGARVDEGCGGVTVRRGALHALTVDASQIPDLIPALCAVLAAAEGESRIVHAARLRLKESDRLHATVQMLRALGIDAAELADEIVLRGGVLRGGAVDVYGDHRIAMAAAVAACAGEGAVTLSDGECVRKSHPDFWEDFEKLKGERV